MGLRVQAGGAPRRPSRRRGRQARHDRGAVGKLGTTAARAHDPAVLATAYALAERYAAALGVPR
jgi:hypothetical protein